MDQVITRCTHTLRDPSRRQRCDDERNATLSTVIDGLSYRISYGFFHGFHTLRLEGKQTPQRR